MCLHVTALLIHTFWLVWVEILTVISFMYPKTPHIGKYLKLSRIFCYFSQAISQTIVNWLFIQFAMPVSLKQEVKGDDDSDYEEEFDQMRDPNLDMMYYVKGMPKMQRLKDVDYEIDRNKGALDYLFEEREQDGSIFAVERDIYDEDVKIDGFHDEVTKKWGEEETQLRTAIYISFVKKQDTFHFRQKIK
jgi:hypothetical protein